MLTTGTGVHPLWLQRLEDFNKGRFAFLSAPQVDGMLEGRVPIIVDGHCIGALGVSGAKPAENAQVAKAGIAALAQAAK